jgi:hypothetical protein
MSPKPHVNEKVLVLKARRRNKKPCKTLCTILLTYHRKWSIKPSSILWFSAVTSSVQEFRGCFLLILEMSSETFTGDFRVDTTTR